MASDTVFHKIVTGDIPAHIIYEDENFLAFLDIAPQFHGQTLVIPKKHTTSKFSEADTNLVKQVMEVGQKVAKILENKLDNISRCIAVIEGFDVDYLHLKLYPTGPHLEGKEVLSEPAEMASQEELAKLRNLLVS